MIGRGSSVSVVVRVEATTAQFKFLLLIGASGDWRRRRSARSTAVVAVAGCGQVQRLPLLLWSAAVVEIVVLGGLWRLRRPRTTLASAARVCGSRMRRIEEEARGGSRAGSVRHFLGRRVVAAAHVVTVVLGRCPRGKVAAAAAVVAAGGVQECAVVPVPAVPPQRIFAGDGLEVGAWLELLAAAGRLWLPVVAVVVAAV